MAMVLFDGTDEFYISPRLATPLRSSSLADELELWFPIQFIIEEHIFLSSRLDTVLMFSRDGFVTGWGDKS